jgi:hypothetical protein
VTDDSSSQLHYLKEKVSAAVFGALGRIYFSPVIFVPFDNKVQSLALMD